MSLFESQKTINANSILDGTYLDSKALYFFRFQNFPSIHFINYVDGEKTFPVVKEKYANEIENIYSTTWYKKESKKFQFDKTIVVLKNHCIIEINDDYCEILHDGSNTGIIEEIAHIAIQHKERQRKQPLEINLIVQSRHGMELKAMEIKRTKLDLNLFYEDEFKEVDATIQSRLKKQNDKGIVLLHGLPGTGKTTYIRYLVGRLKKRVLFLSPSVAGNLMNPEFIELLVDNPNSILVIEDAENIIMDRRFNSSSSVSNLLNISDGLLADFLNVQLICTFNSSISNIDSALLRKGRLIARYEFGKLGINKAQRLSTHFGHSILVNEPMTIAEIANPFEKPSQPEERPQIGFRQRMVETV